MFYSKKNKYIEIIIKYNRNQGKTVSNSLRSSFDVYNIFFCIIKRVSPL